MSEWPNGANLFSAVSCFTGRQMGPDGRLLTSSLLASYSYFVLYQAYYCSIHTADVNVGMVYGL